MCQQVIFPAARLHNLILLNARQVTPKLLKLTASLASPALAKGLGMEGTSTELLPEKASDLGLGPLICNQHIDRHKSLYCISCTAATLKLAQSAVAGATEANLAQGPHSAGQAAACRTGA